MTPGLSALVRLRDEEAWCQLALESIVDWCDEIVIVLNLSRDGTRAIAQSFGLRYPKKVFGIYEYPHEIWPMGPGHDAVPATDPRSSAAFYNFTASQATRTHHLKWDGDMVAQDWLGASVRGAMAAGHERIKLFGTDIVGDELTHVGCHPDCPTNGVYPARTAHYAQGVMTQNLRGVPDPTMQIGSRERPAFLHFKWARKSFDSATVQWPPDWRNEPHFQRIAERRHPVAPYTGEYPASVRALL